MTHKFLTLIILFSAVFFIRSNGQDTNKSFDYGIVEMNIYRNAFFDFEMVLPDEWVVQSRDQIEHLKKRGKALVAGENQNMKAMLNASDISSAYLLAAFQFEAGSAVDFNPSIAIIAENVKNFPGIKSGKEYLFHASRLMEQSQLKYKHIDKEFAALEINGTTFHVLNAGIKVVGGETHQRYFVTIKEGFSFIVCITYSNSQQEEMLLQSINSMKFSQ